MAPQLLTRELVSVACARIDIVIDLLGHLEGLKQVVEWVTSLRGVSNLADLRGRGRVWRALLATQ